MLSWGTLYRICNSSTIWIWVSVLICNHRTSLDMNTVFRAYSRISDWTTLATLKFWIWHTFIVILIWVLLNILKINGISVGLGSCRSRALHYQIWLVLRILLCIIWRYSIRHTHCWIMLVEHLLLSNYNLISIFAIDLLLLLSHYISLSLGRIVCWMKRMDWSASLSWKLWSDLRRS